MTLPFTTCLAKQSRSYMTTCSACAPAQTNTCLGTRLLSVVREIHALWPQSPELFVRYSIRPPRGLLLHGPPGCGKTALARSAAAAAGAALFVLNGSDVVSEVAGDSEAGLKGVLLSCYRAARIRTFCSAWPLQLPDQHSCVVWLMPSCFAGAGVLCQGLPRLITSRCAGSDMRTMYLPTCAVLHRRVCLPQRTQRRQPSSASSRQALQI